MEQEFTKNIAQSFAKGQPYANRIGLTLFRNKISMSSNGTETDAENDKNSNKVLQKDSSHLIKRWFCRKTNSKYLQDARR